MIAAKIVALIGCPVPPPEPPLILAIFSSSLLDPEWADAAI